MPVYSVKNDETLAIRAFSSSKAAYDFGSRQQVFATDGELYNTNLTDAQLREVYYLVTGFETRVQYRDYLCELIFNAIEAAGLPMTDKEGDCAIVSDHEPVEPEPVELKPEPEPEPEPVELVCFDDPISGIVHLIPKPPTPDPEPEMVEDEPPTMDPEPAAILKLIVDNTFDESEAEKRLANAMIYGTSHPEIYKTAPKVSKKDLVLSDTPKTKYSRREVSIFETIVEAYPEPITTKDIIERKFKSYKKYHVKNAIAVTTKSLASKIAYNDEPFLLKIGGKSGPKPMSVWLEGKGEEK